MNNPLLQLFPSARLPAFDQIAPEHAAPAIDAVLAQNRAELATLLARDLTAPTWDGFVTPLEELGDRLARVWSACSHLWGVANTDAWRAAYSTCLPQITAYSLELAQSEPLFRAYERIAASAEFQAYSPTRRKVIADALRDFRLSGIALAADAKARFKAIALRLSDLQTRFEENLVDAIQAWSRPVADGALLAGMTDAARAAAAQKARGKGLDGWLLTLDFPSFDAVITYADDRELRRELYTAFATRASEQGPHAGRFDNSALMLEILALRHEQAQLLGYANFADLSLATKMADSPRAVEGFLRDLATRARPRALRELAELADFARAQGGPVDLQPWDVPYYAEKLKERKLGLSDEELRPFFPVAQVVEGMFVLVERLYGVRFVPTSAPVWHADVTVYELQDRDGRRLALFYLDPYARDNKRSGAWMDECIARRRTADGVQQPVAYLTCNFTPPLEGRTALLTHDEVLTLFHEFGHGLHHLLTQVDEAAVSGIHGVAWDAVELPSQFMENWCYQAESLALIARHHETGAPLPADLLRRLRDSRTFHSGLATLRQLEFALFDLLLHRDYGPGIDVMATLERVRDEVSVLRPPSWNRMPHSFSHIFAGGYAAGYYSYKWAEVLSADAFAAFEEEGLFNPDVSRRFRDTILAQGGSREAGELFVAFRGRKPTIEALLRQTGLDQAA